LPRMVIGRGGQGKVNVRAVNCCRSSAAGAETSHWVLAHVGHDTLHLARLVGSTSMEVSSEPKTDNFALLKRNVELNGYGNAEFVNAAVSDQAGRWRLYRCGDNAGDHRLHAAAEDRPSVEVEVVTATGVDELARKIDAGHG
jgi:FkbM family methyltransferase